MRGFARDHWVGVVCISSSRSQDTEEWCNNPQQKTLEENTACTAKCGESPVTLEQQLILTPLPATTDHSHPEPHPPREKELSSSPASALRCTWGRGELPEFLFLSTTPCNIPTWKSGLNRAVGQSYAC